MGKIEPEVSGFKSLFGGACLDEMEEFKGRDTALQKNVTKKVFKSEMLKYEFVFIDCI